MSYRIASIMELPPHLRAQVENVVEKCKKLKAPAAEELRRQQLKAEREKLVLAMLKGLEYENLGMLFEREYQFCSERGWKLDLYSRAFGLAIECHGGINEDPKRRGRHIRAGGFRRDREKMNAAVECGIRVLEFWPEAIADGSAVAQVKRMVRGAT